MAQGQKTVNICDPLGKPGTARMTAQLLLGISWHGRNRTGHRGLLLDMWVEMRHIG